MRVLLTGADGMLARAIVKVAPPSVEIIARSRAQFDVTDADAIEREFTAVNPAVIINAAAYTAVDRAESDVDAAQRVNGAAPGLLGAAAARIWAKVMHFSTDHVFDGNSALPYREDARPNPVNAYGRSKLQGERALVESGARHAIVRTQWLFGDSGRSFPDTMWTRARAGLPTQVVHDQSGAPTYTGDLADAMWSVLEHEGIINVVSEGGTTWFEVARRIFAAAGRSELLTPCTSSEYPVAARRPTTAFLDTSRLRSLGIVLPHWTDAIDGFIARRMATE